MFRFLQIYCNSGRSFRYCVNLQKGLRRISERGLFDPHAWYYKYTGLTLDCPPSTNCIIPYTLMPAMLSNFRNIRRRARTWFTRAPLR